MRNGFNDIAHVTGGIPERFERLRLAGAIGSFDFEIEGTRLVSARTEWSIRERNICQDPCQVCLAPVVAAVLGELNFFDAVTAVERDPADHDAFAAFQFLTFGETRDE